MTTTKTEQEIFRENLFRFQEEKGMSEHALSQAIGRCDSYVQSLSSGKNMPRFSNFIEICRALDREPYEFLIENQGNDYIAQTIRCMQELPEDARLEVLRHALKLNEEQKK